MSFIINIILDINFNFDYINLLQLNKIVNNIIHC